VITLRAPNLSSAASESCMRADAPALHYVMYGLEVESDVVLPQLACSDADRWREPDVIFRRATAADGKPVPVGEVVAREECATHGEEVVVRRGATGTWIWNRAAGFVHVSPDCHEAILYPDEHADERVLGLMLAGQVSVFILHQFGYPTLHASAVVGDAGAVAFLGPRGHGKSTMAAAFVQRGMALLTDDVLPLQADGATICAIPGVPYMKLWPETVEGTFKLEDHLPDLLADQDKKLLRLDERFAFAQRPAPLRALYVVQRYDAAQSGSDQVTITRLSSRDALAMILAQISFGAFLYPRERVRLLAYYTRLIAQAPVRLLYFPHGFEFQSRVCDRVLMDLAEMSAA
jgi:hypothetical protein